MVNKVFQLSCGVNSYPWGKPGRESISATLCEKTPGNGFELDQSKPYAEM